MVKKRSNLGSNQDEIAMDAVDDTLHPNLSQHIRNTESNFGVVTDPTSGAVVVSIGVIFVIVNM